jgi:PTH1 family peptidyl-tRNA hydrolase
MNDSGRATRALLDFHKLIPDNILVIHDDLDIELGKYKIAQDSRSAGHNGVQNIIDALGTQKFRRIRIGIAKPPEEKDVCQINAHDYVLQKFSSEELEVLEKVLEEISEEIKKIVT